MMKLHYADKYKEVDIADIIRQIFEGHAVDDIRDMLAHNRWNLILISIIDDCIVSQLRLNEMTRLEEVFYEDDLAEIRKEVVDRLKYVFQ